MRSNTEIEQRRAEILKAVRSVIRLKHSIAADREVNGVLPQIELELDAAIKTGKIYELEVADFIREVQ